MAPSVPTAAPGSALCPPTDCIPRNPALRRRRRRRKFHRNSFWNFHRSCVRECVYVGWDMYIIVIIRHTNGYYRPLRDGTHASVTVGHVVILVVIIGTPGISLNKPRSRRVPTCKRIQRFGERC